MPRLGKFVSPLVIIVVVLSMHVRAADNMVCPTPPASAVNLYRTSTCAGYRSCDASFCNCVGSSVNGSTTAMECAAAASSAVASANFTLCLDAQITCLTRLAVYARTEATDPCFSWSSEAYVELLKTAVRASYVGSGEQAQCQSYACQLINASTSDTIKKTSLPALYSSVCYARNIDRRVVLQGTVQLGGSQWQIAAQQQSAGLLQVALQADLANALAVGSSSIVATPPTVATFAGITSMTATFSVYETTTTTAQLLTSVQTALATPLGKWLPTTVGQYSGTDASLQAFGATAGATVAPVRHEYYLVVSGGWAAIHQVTAAYANRTRGGDALDTLNRALVSDIAKYLGTVTQNIVVASVMYCRLVVRFSVSESAGFNDAAVTAKLEAAAMVPGWLANTAAVYADLFSATTVANATVIAQNVTSVVRDFTNTTNSPFAVMMTNTGCNQASVGIAPPPTPSSAKPNPTLMDPGYQIKSQTGSAAPAFLAGQRRATSALFAGLALITALA